MSNESRQWIDHVPNKFESQSGAIFYLRGMSFKDLDQVVALEKMIFPSPWSKQAFINELVLNTFAQTWVAVNRQNRVVLYLIAWHILDELHIANIAVSPEYRRQGLAQWTLTVLLQEAQKRGIKVAYLEVRVSNKAAIQLYKKFGFKVVGLREKYYKEENEDALLMSLDLNKSAFYQDVE